jgi:hypothetical protein
MENASVAKCLQLISEAYPGRWKPTKQTVSVWRELLSDVDDKNGLAAVAQLCSSEVYPPTISQIREMALDKSGLKKKK